MPQTCGPFATPTRGLRPTTIRLSESSLAKRLRDRLRVMPGRQRQAAAARVRQVDDVQPGLGGRANEIRLEQRRSMRRIVHVLER